MPQGERARWGLDKKVELAVAGRQRRSARSGIGLSGAVENWRRAAATTIATATTVGTVAGAG